MARAARPSQRIYLQAQAVGPRGDATSGWWGARGALPETPEQKYRLFYLSAPPVSKCIIFMRSLGFICSRPATCCTLSRNGWETPGPTVYVLPTEDEVSPALPC